MENKHRTEVIHERKRDGEMKGGSHKHKSASPKDLRGGLQSKDETAKEQNEP